jgi:hypothetical protein
VDRRPLCKRFDAEAGLSLHDAMIFYGPEHEAETVAVLELEGYGGPGPMLDASGWPDEAEERDYRVKSFRLQDRTRVLQQALLRKLRNGDVYATGYSSQSALDEPAARITPDRWRVLRPNFLTSEAESQTGMIAGILVFKAVVSKDVSEQPARFSPGALRTWYEHWVSKNAHDGKTPSRSDDLAAAKAEFGVAVPRNAIRALRRELAPPEWRHMGRRKRG